MPDESRPLPATPEARARAILPVLRAEADAIEAGKRLTPATLDALHAQRLFRTLVPRSVGGDEVRPSDHSRMLTAIASTDASTAWCLSQAGGCALAAAYVAPEVARHVWGPADAVLAWGQSQGARARVVEGGYAVTGRWTFVSGGHHATWIGGHAHIEERDGTLRRHPDGRPVERTMLIPRADLSVTSDWEVIGLRGTGSDTFSVPDGYFVPEAYALARDVEAERREDGPLYRFQTNHFYGSGFASVALGVARGLLDLFVDLARDKHPTLTGRGLKESQAVQRDLAIAEARWRAARAGVIAALDEAWEAALLGPMPLDQRMGIRMASTFAIHQAREVADFCWREAGATAIFEANGFARRYRDMLSVTQQVQGRMIHFETVGQHLLGLSDASTRFA
jgi:alkylation response protein AidB-like acyl-CoA dehydrogenase